MGLVSSVFSTFDGQVRSRAESDLPDSGESSGRSTLEVLHADVLCIGLDNERQCTNPDPIRGGNQRSRGTATDTQSVRARHSESTFHTEGFESGTALAEAVMYTVMMNMAPILPRNSLQSGTYANSTDLRAALLQWCYPSRNCGANPTV